MSVQFVADTGLFHLELAVAVAVLRINSGSFMKKVIAIAVGSLMFSGAAMAAAPGAMSWAEAALPAMLAHAGHHHDTPEKSDPASAIYYAPISKTVSVSDCWVRLLPAPAPSAGYFVVKNNGAKDVKVTAVASAAFEMMMLHQTTQADGMSKMSMVDDVLVPAGGQLEFKPGSFHAMLEKPKKELQIGARTAIDFLFDSGEKVVALCEIKPATAMSH
jgi:copper(I)-binding protein